MHRWSITIIVLYGKRYHRKPFGSKDKRYGNLFAPKIRKPFGSIKIKKIQKPFGSKRYENLSDQNTDLKDGGRNLFPPPPPPPLPHHGMHMHALFLSPSSLPPQKSCRDEIYRTFIGPIEEHFPLFGCIGNAMSAPFPHSTAIAWIFTFASTIFTEQYFISEMGPLPHGQLIWPVLPLVYGSI